MRLLDVALTCGGQSCFSGISKNKYDGALSKAGAESFVQPSFAFFPLDSCTHLLCSCGSTDSLQRSPSSALLSVRDCHPEVSDTTLDQREPHALPSRTCNREFG